MSQAMLAVEKKKCIEFTLTFSFAHNKIRLINFLFARQDDPKNERLISTFKSHQYSFVQSYLYRLSVDQPSQWFLMNFFWLNFFFSFDHSFVNFRITNSKNCLINLHFIVHCSKVVIPTLLIPMGEVRGLAANNG